VTGKEVVAVKPDKNEIEYAEQPRGLRPAGFWSRHVVGTSISCDC
jgi:hypothetical protein